MKYIIFALSLILNLLISFTTVEAADYYLGVYEDGAKAYLDTNSIRDHQVYRNGYLEANVYDCTVKAVYSDGVDYVSYTITFSYVEILKKNGKEYGRKELTPYLETHPVEANLMKFMRQMDRQRNRQR